MRLIIIIVPSLQFDEIVRLQWQTTSALFKIILSFITNGIPTDFYHKKKKEKKVKWKIRSSLGLESNIANVNTTLMGVNECMYIILFYCILNIAWILIAFISLWNLQNIILI